MSRPSAGTVLLQSILLAWAIAASIMLVLALISQHSGFRAGYRMGAYNYIDKMGWCAADLKRPRQECADLMHTDVQQILALELVP